MKKQLMALVLAMVFTLVPVSSLAQEEVSFATRAQVADMLLSAADDYHEGLTRADIVKGYPDGTVRDDAYITRAESFVMISRAFGTLPEPKGNDKRQNPQNVSFSDVPDWAKTEIDNLTSAGVVVGTDDGILSPDQTVTMEQVNLIVSRIWALFGTNLRDDFYNTVNKEELDNSVLAPGEMAAGGFNDLNNVVNSRVGAIIQEIVSGGPYEKGTKEQKIADFYQNIIDVEGRNAQGIAPIQKYLDAFRAASTMDELYQASLTLKQETGMSLLVDFSMGIDDKNSTQYIMCYSGMAPSLTKDMYAQGGALKDAYTNYISKLLVLGGETPEEAASQAEAFYAFEAVLAQNQMEQQDYSNVDKVYNVYTPAQLQEIFSQVDIEKTIRDGGFTVPDKIIVPDVQLMQAYSSYFTQDNIELLKTVAKIRVLSNMGGALSTAFDTAAEEFQRVLYGVEGGKTQEEYALLQVQNVMTDYLGELYVERYFSEEAKQDVENMVKEFISIFASRIQKLDWMSEATKKMAVKKLDAMTVKVGYPDQWDSFIDAVDVKSKEEGGSFFENICAMSREQLKQGVALQGEEVDKSMWMLSAYTVNAYYNPTANEIVFPAGILQAPFYDYNAKREENLGGIGTVIAHEITHAFDNNGAKFDENGNATDWWTPEDYQKFQELCQNVVDYYEGAETAPGIATNGALTLSENIADIGGMACALEAVSKLSKPDYNAFFHNYAKIWMMTTTREYQEMLSQMDVHSPNKVRVNRVVSCFDEFYQTYGITQADGMYVPPAARVKIW